MTTARPMKAVVVGAGPAGCATALHLARKPNMHVQLLEKRSIADLVASCDTARSYPMVLSRRALNTLDNLELDLPSTTGRYDGIKFLPKGNTMSLNGTTRLVSRNQLANDLLRAAAQHNNISIQFGTTPSGIDLAAKHLFVDHAPCNPAETVEMLERLLMPTYQPAVASVQQSGGAGVEHAESAEAMGFEQGQVASSTVVASRLSAALAVSAGRLEGGVPSSEIEYDLLVAADGSRSQVRSMLESLGEIAVSHISPQTEGPQAVKYQTFSDIVVPRDADGSRFVFASPDTDPRRNLFFLESKDRKCKLVFWRSDSDHLCGMVPGTQMMLSTLDADGIRAVFGEAIPDWMVTQLAEQLRNQEMHDFGRISKCSQLHALGGVVLLGDAGHCVTSRFGQGCNMALESVEVFNSVVDSCLSSGQGLGAVPEQFTATRLPDVAAMQDLEHMHICLSSDASYEGASSLELLEKVKFQLHSKVALGSAFLIGALQWKLMPDKYTTIPMYDMLYDGKKPYRAVLTYVNQTASFVYFIISFLAVAVSINAVEVILE